MMTLYLYYMSLQENI